ncbi:MAG: hypothetical protein R2882_06180 [Gemmatimonadales bacterium]
MAYLEELRQIAALGFTTREVLTMATRGNAEAPGHGRSGWGRWRRASWPMCWWSRGGRTSGSTTWRVDLVIRDGRVQVRDGRIYQARHVPAAAAGGCEPAREPVEPALSARHAD